MTDGPVFLSHHIGTAQGAKEVLSVGDLGVSNPAHGPACGAQALADAGAIDCENSPGVSTDNPGRPGAPISSPVNGGAFGINFNVGAWNAVFGPGGISNENSAICGIGTTAGTFDADNNCD